MLWSELNWNAAFQSFLVPGWGQFEQRRAHAGRVFLAWAVLALLLAAYAPLLGVPPALVWLELALVTLWAAGDALVACKFLFRCARVVTCEGEEAHGT